MQSCHSYTIILHHWVMKLCPTVNQAKTHWKFNSLFPLQPRVASIAICKDFGKSFNWVPPHESCMKYYYLILFVYNVCIGTHQIKDIDIHMYMHIRMYLLYWYCQTYCQKAVTYDTYSHIEVHCIDEGFRGSFPWGVEGVVRNWQSSNRA